MSDNELTAPGVYLLGARVPPIRWSSEAVRRMDEEVEWARNSNPSGPAEIVGLLLGRPRPITEIVDCEPVFVISERDHAEAFTSGGKRQIERSLAAFQTGRDGELSVIGFYRSHSGDQLDLTEQDLELLRTSFRDTQQIVLLMKLAEDGSVMAKLFAGEHAGLAHEVHAKHSAGRPRWFELCWKLSQEPKNGASPTDPSLRSGLRMSDPEGTEPAHTTPPPRTRPDPLRRPVPEMTEDVEPAPAPANRRPSLRKPIFLLAIMIIAAVLLAYRLLNKPAGLNGGAGDSGSAAVASGSSQPFELALRAERHGDDLSLEWDHNAPMIVRSSSGILLVREGDGPEQQLMLDENLLKTGKVVYRGRGGKVVFRLIVFGQSGAKLGESVTTLPGRMSGIKGEPNKESK